MATVNRISAVLSDADLTAVLTAIGTIKSKLPFLISLDKSDREKLRKMGSKRQGYVKNTSDGVKAFPAAMPASYPTVEYLKDADLMVAMSKIGPLMMGLAANFDDTYVQLGAELMANTDLAYGLLKQAAKTDSNIKPTVEKIAAALKQKPETPFDEVKK